MTIMGKRFFENGLVMSIDENLRRIKITINLLHFRNNTLF
ncbi:hypothetical protein HS7_09690 [Sulfolobales archaeon HS-7]|nr:hypothetical protein HS7_09690 [Sulfolobales archaeon HS-7]